MKISRINWLIHNRLWPFYPRTSIHLLNLPIHLKNNARIFHKLINYSNSPWLVPSIGDIKPDGGKAFEKRLKQFHHDLGKDHQTSNDINVPQNTCIATNKSHDTGESSKIQSLSSSSSLSTSASLSTSSLSSSSSSTVESDSSNKDVDAQPKLKSVVSPLSNLLYGTPEGRQQAKELQQSVSRALARGKYVHSIVFHHVKPDRVTEYVQLVGRWYMRIASTPEFKVNLVGSWRTEIGDCDTFVHIWEYQQYLGYHLSRNAIQSHPEFANFTEKLRNLINGTSISLMQEFSFWPTTTPRRLGGIFELRSYSLHPGQLLEWETQWRRGVNARRKTMEGVGAWFVILGGQALPFVHHLWQFADLQDRQNRREQSWSLDSGWGKTVSKSVPMVKSIQSRVMVALPWSPVA